MKRSVLTLTAAAVVLPGNSLAWRCRELDGAFADECSTGTGKAVFTCRSLRGRLTCRNRDRGGFWVTATRFGVL